MTIARIATGALVALLIALGAPAAAHAKPKPPSELTVGDRARPLNVHGAPRFGWMVGDGRQSAYQLQVTRDGAPVWDSGRVGSSRAVLRAVRRPGARARDVLRVDRPYLGRGRRGVRLGGARAVRHRASGTATGPARAGSAA